jgi:glycosyl hydrolase family 12
MRNTSHVALSVTSLVALLSAFGCSSDGGGGDEGLNAFVPGGGGASATGVAGSSGISGSGGTTSPVGVAGASSEGQGGSSFNAGLGGSATAAGGAAGAPPVTDQAPQATPGGYFESGEWHGYAWTGDDALGIGTTRSVEVFDALPANSPFCLEGTVGADPDTDGAGPLGYRGVALLGFNVQQEPFAEVEGQEPPIGSTTPTGTGVAVNYTKSAGQTLRIQLQGPEGETDANQRWCAELTAVQGPAFVPYSEFRTSCWLAEGAAGSVPYAMQPIAAVVMTVPGDAAAPVPYNICVAGFADANSIEDAPTFDTPAGLLTGTLSGAAARTKVIGRDGNSYIINNNAWGVNSGDGTQQIRFTGNSFEVLRQTAGPGGDSSPASFPSIYVGANGATTGVNGASTAGENPLPLQVSAITALPTRFRHNSSSGDNNATYDVWFAPSPPQGEYDTALAAFLMVWTYKPGTRVAIGTSRGQADVGGRTWELFVGPRGGGGPDSNLPVISYVNTGAAVLDYEFDLKAFIDDAVARNVGLTTTMFLTDVFAGFEIWSGGAGLRVDEFSIGINP